MTGEPTEVAPQNPSESGPKKKLKRVRKVRVEKPTDDSTITDPPHRFGSHGSPVFKTLTASPFYLALLVLRFLLIFVTPATLEGTEFADGVDNLAVALLPDMNSKGLDPAVLIPPDGMGDVNRTRSIVGAFLSSGLPYMGANLVCNKVLLGCPASWMGYIALYAPRVWMFFLGLIGDVLLARAFAAYEGEKAVWAMLTYASSWTTLLAMARNANFALEALCVAGLVAACFGWQPNVARPVFWLSATSLALGIWLRPAFVFMIFTPIIYLSSLWGKSGIDPLKYVRAGLEGMAIFAFWATIWVTVDSVYFGTFKLRFGDTVMTSFDMFVEYATKGLPFSYKGSLVYTPLNAMREVANRKFLSTLAMNTSPGQMFLSLPAILGPLFIVLMREAYEGLKVAMKELMTELKQAANAKKNKKRKTKKAGMTKDLEDELYVYYDTIQTTFLLGLLIEVVQNNDRLGSISLLSLMPPCMICIAATIYGPNSSYRFRVLHLVFTAGMVLFYGFLNQSGIPRVLLRAGAGGMDQIPHGADLVLYKGIVGHRSLLGPNIKNISVHDAGESYLKLMTTIRDLKNRDGYDEDRLLVLAPGTVAMKEEEFSHHSTLAYGHMSAHEMPNNIDDAFKKSRLEMYKFVGDEDEAIIRDNEEAEEEEEREREAKEQKKKRKKKKEQRSEEKEEL